MTGETILGVAAVALAIVGGTLLGDVVPVDHRVIGLVGALAVFAAGAFFGLMAHDGGSP